MTEAQQKNKVKKPETPREKYMRNGEIVLAIATLATAQSDLKAGVPFLASGLLEAVQYAAQLHPDAVDDLKQHGRVLGAGEISESRAEKMQAFVESIAGAMIMLGHVD